MNRLLIAMLASALMLSTAQAAKPDTAPSEFRATDVSLDFVSEQSVLAGVSYGLDAVDGQTLILSERTTAHLAGGVRTIAYSCPNAESGALTFRFDPGQRYELVCRGNQPALIRPAEDRC